MKNIYITTTLPYVNAKPHIGFALEIVRADTLARLQRLKGVEVFFNTGTDEHGLKIHRKAEEHGVGTQEYVDGFAANLIMTSTVNEPARRAAAAGTGQAAAHLRKRSGFESSPCLSGACQGR